MESKIPENGLLKKSHPFKKETYSFIFLFLLRDNGNKCLILKFQVSKLKIVIEVRKLSIWPQKCLILKRL